MLPLLLRTRGHGAHARSQQQQYHVTSLVSRSGWPVAIGRDHISSYPPRISFITTPPSAPASEPPTVISSTRQLRLRLRPGTEAQYQCRRRIATSASAIASPGTRRRTGSEVSAFLDPRPLSFPAYRTPARIQQQRRSLVSAPALATTSPPAHSTVTEKEKDEMGGRGGTQTVHTTLRLKALRDLMNEHGVDVYVVPSEDQREYSSDFPSPPSLAPIATFRFQRIPSEL